MTKTELNNLNNLLINEVRAYIETDIEGIFDRIKTYKNVYSALNIEHEYHKVINKNYLNYINLDFYSKEKIKDIIEILEDHKIKIHENILIDGLDSFCGYLSELVWDIKIDIKDKVKLENELLKIA